MYGSPETPSNILDHWKAQTDARLTIYDEISPYVVTPGDRISPRMDAGVNRIFLVTVLISLLYCVLNLGTSEDGYLEPISLISIRYKHWDACRSQKVIQVYGHVMYNADLLVFTSLSVKNLCRCVKTKYRLEAGMCEQSAPVEL